MEITWNTITESERGFKKKRIFSEYNLYVEEQNYDIIELGETIGKRYFMFDLCIDEIVELFFEMNISEYSNNMTDFYAFVMFFFKKALFNKQVDKYEAMNIFNDFLDDKSEFTQKLINCKKTEDDFVHTQFIKFLERLNYSW